VSAGTWALTKADVRRLDAFETWINKNESMEKKISCADKISNEELLAKVEEDGQIIKIIRQR